MSIHKPGRGIIYGPSSIFHKPAFGNRGRVFYPGGGHLQRRADSPVPARLRVLSALRLLPGGDLVDINRAAQAELETLPGIGPAMARRIIDYREQNGAFLSPEDLTKVKGIGEKTLEKLLPYIVCN